MSGEEGNAQKSTRETGVKTGMQKWERCQVQVTIGLSKIRFDTMMGTNWDGQNN